MNDKIVFTTQSDSGYSETITNEPKKLGARLVDGPSPLAGRLQIFYENKWRSVCTNSRKQVFNAHFEIQSNYDSLS